MANTMLMNLVCLVVVCMVVEAFTTMQTANAAVTTCRMVSKSLAPCMPYLKGTGGAPPPANCCTGVQSLKAAAQTTADRRFACNCMKTAAAAAKSLNYKLANTVASQCGVRIGYS